MALRAQGVARIGALGDPPGGQPSSGEDWPTKLRGAFDVVVLHLKCFSGAPGARGGYVYIYIYIYIIRCVLFFPGDVWDFVGPPRAPGWPEKDSP